MARGKGFSSHGSLTKAGRVRFEATPEVKRTGVNSRKKKIPRVRYRELYNKRIVKEKYGGQPNSIGANKQKRGNKNERSKKNKKNL